MFKRPHYFALIAVLLLVLIVLNLPGQTASQIKVALGTFFLPLFGLARSVEKAALRAQDAVVPRSVLQTKLNDLNEKNAELMFQIMQSTQLWKENQRLRQTLNWPAKQQWRIKPAAVMLRDPATWWRTMQIDVGQRDGIVTNMPVLTTDGLVGKIGWVGNRNSQVILIGNPQCTVAAVIQKPKSEIGANGIIKSSSSGILDPSVVRFTMVDRNSAVSPGDPVETSGLGPVFPKGIPVGHVLSMNSVDFGLMNEADVRLSANMRDLDYVWVLFP